MTTSRAMQLVTVLVIVGACGKESNRADTATADSASSGGMAGMPGMGGMSGMMSSRMMDSMAAHMRVMDTARAVVAEAMMPMHRQMVANMLSQMNSEMRSMNMSVDARWTALMDSVRQDLVRMPETSAQQRKDMMPAHHGRVTLLMRLHGGMLAEMKN